MLLSLRKLLLHLREVLVDSGEVLLNRPQVGIDPGVETVDFLVQARRLSPVVAPQSGNLLTKTHASVFHLAISTPFKKVLFVHAN